MASKKRSKVARLLEPAERAAAAALRQEVRKLLLRRPSTLAEMAARWKAKEEDIRAVLRDLRSAGANIVEVAGAFEIDRHLSASVEDAYRLRPAQGSTYRVGLVADSHLGSKHERLDVLHDLYDWFASEGIRTVLHAGNWIEGEARFNKHELQDRAHGMQAQLDYFAEHYPERSGVQTLYIAGDDHEGWYAKQHGVDIGRMLEDTARSVGRSDLTYLGYKEAFLRMEHPGTKKHARLLLDHPGGGSAYALSYAPQKCVEAAQGGEKPAIWCFGHWHKAGYFQIRGVHCILVPCTKDLDTFGRKFRLSYVIGGVLLEATQHEGGAITEVNPRFRLAFDRGYYNQQFSMSGQPKRRKA